MIHSISRYDHTLNFYRLFVAYEIDEGFQAIIHTTQGETDQYITEALEKGDILPEEKARQYFPKLDHLKYFQNPSKSKSK